MDALSSRSAVRAAAQAAPATASAIHLDTTIRHVGTAGTNPLAPKMPSTSMNQRTRSLAPHAERTDLSGGLAPPMVTRTRPRWRCGIQIHDEGPVTAIS